MSTTIDIATLNWKECKHDPDASMEKATRQTDWHKLCQLASDLRDGVPCVPLDRATNGLNNMARLLQFSDGMLWVARISMRTSAAASAKLSSEIDTMLWIREQSSLPVPRVYGYDVDKDNAVGAPFVLMEFLPGNTVMDAGGGFEVHRGTIPEARREHFYREVAKCHVSMTSLRAPKIGMIRKTPDGTFDVGPFPDIGGPFSTATAYLEAWIEHAQFPRRPDEILDIMKGGPAEEILHAITVFPRRFREVAHTLVQNDHGPFPLCHIDFLHSNIIADDDLNVLGIIDWEGACTVPLELVQFPRFLSAMPRLFGSPSSYDEHGQPLDDDTRLRWRERQDYVQMVKSYEDASDHDNALSTCLAYDKGLALSYIMEEFENGKMGFYDRVMDGLQDGLAPVDG